MLRFGANTRSSRAYLSKVLGIVQPFFVVFRLLRHLSKRTFDLNVVTLALHAPIAFAALRPHGPDGVARILAAGLGLVVVPTAAPSIGRIGGRGSLLCSLSGLLGGAFHLGLRARYAICRQIGKRMGWYDIRSKR